MNRYAILSRGQRSGVWDEQCRERQIVSVYVRLMDKRTAEVHWDYQPGEVSKVLFDNEKYLDGYITALLDALAVPDKGRICHSPLTGTISGLSHEIAEQLAGLIADKLVPLCEARKKKIDNYNNLPDVKFQREKTEKSIY